MHINNMLDFRGDHDLDWIVASATSMVEWAMRHTCNRQFPLDKATLLFLEPSIRTNHSTEEAAMNLGMRVTNIKGTDHLSITKGESLADTFRMLAGQGARVLAIRTRIEGAPLFAARICQQYADQTSIINPYPLSVINCGDGTRWHPTQTVLDSTTIKYYLHRLDNFTLGIMGDPSKGRTSHTLLQAYQNRPGMRFVIVAPKGFEMPPHYKQGLANVTESDSLDALADCDIVYVTRFQTERMTPAEKLFIESVRQRYIINRQVLDSWNPNVKIMHPLPRVEEIAWEISLDPRVVAFQQAEFGIAARMAILTMLLEGKCVRFDLSPKPVVFLENETSSAVDSAKTLRHFQPVQKGTVVDHIPPGQVRYVFRILETLNCLPEGLSRQAVQYVKSAKYPDGKKDVLLLHDFQIPDQAGAVIQTLFPKATVNIIPGDGNIVKRRYRAPHGLTENVRCSNIDCITNHDREATPNFIFEDLPDGNRQLNCEYCGRPLWD